MRAREFISELDTSGTAPIAPQAGTLSSSQPQDTAKLSAMITGLQKQIQDLQKSALQTSAAATAPTASSVPSSASSVGTTNNTLVPGQPDNSQNTPPNSTTQSAGGIVKPIPSVQGLTANKAVPVSVPGVNQTPQVTNMKIKQQLAQTQGRSA